MNESPYTREFYQDLQANTERSAKEIVPLIVELIKPKSVIDVGCGEGIWLAAFESLGIEDILGIDGDHIDPSRLMIPNEKFMPVDLGNPFQLKRQFDLVVCLEVAEHLPQDSAEAFIDSLTRLGPIVLFSAAIPFQGGEHHVNEQWPEYWAALFKARDYVAIDCVRNKIWNNDNVQWWYAQNILLFVRAGFLKSCSALSQEYETRHSPLLSLVHPKKYMSVIWTEMLGQAVQEVRGFIPSGTSYIVIDDGKLGIERFGANAVPFLEREGAYWGPPEDDQTAVRELETLHKRGAEFAVFLWSAFWWLDYYTKLNHHLVSTYCCVLQSDRLMVFDLKNKPDSRGD